MPKKSPKEDLTNDETLKELHLQTSSQVSLLAENLVYVMFTLAIVFTCFVIPHFINETINPYFITPEIKNLLEEFGL